MSDSVTVLDTRQMHRVGGQIGSNPAGVFEDNNGKRYYVKNLESLAHVRNEWLAAKLYQLAGAPTLIYVPTVDPLQIATEWLELDKTCVAHFSEDERRQAQHWFGVHCWTANWDAAGYNGDNQGVFNGRVLTLDVGGALSFRAQGDPKGKAFAAEVNELETLRTDPDNPHAVKLFGDMTEPQLRRSIQVVTAISDQAIAAVMTECGASDKLLQKLLCRKADMARKLLSEPA